MGDVRGLRGLELRARGLSPLDPRGAMGRSTKAKLFARVTFTLSGEFLGVRKTRKTLGESELSLEGFLRFSDGALCAPSRQRGALAAQERLLAFP